MIIPVEIMLRHDERVFSETIDHPRDPSALTAADIAQILEEILVRIDRLQHPGRDERPAVSLRGMSWIVSPCRDGVAIAFEIHSASAVAGPFALPQATLERLTNEAFAAALRPPTTIH
jgi:hypothetical protein